MYSTYILLENTYGASTESGIVGGAQTVACFCKALEVKEWFLHFKRVIRGGGRRATKIGKSM